MTAEGEGEEFPRRRFLAGKEKIRERKGEGM